MAVAFSELSAFARYGYLGVQLFFLISGFVILMTAQSGSARLFVISRIARLYPAFWVCCTATFLLIVSMGGPQFTATSAEYALNMTMLSGIVSNVPSIDGVYWTLFVEIHFYFLMILILLFGMLRYLDWFVGLWFALTVAMAIHPVSKLQTWFVTEYSSYFISGQLAYLIYSQGARLRHWLLLAGCLLMSVWQEFSRLEQMAAHFHTSFSKGVVAGVVGASYAVMLLVALRKLDAKHKVFVALGALTYPLYLLHQVTGYILFNALDGYLNRYVLLAGIVGLMLLASYGVSRYFERPLAGRIRAALQGRSRPMEQLL